MKILKSIQYSLETLKENKSINKQREELNKDIFAKIKDENVNMGIIFSIPEYE